MSSTELFTELLNKYVTNAISDSEKETLFQMIRTGKYQVELAYCIDEIFNQSKEWNIAEDHQLKTEIFEYINTHKAPFRKINYLKTIISIAAILVVLLTGLLFVLDRIQSPKPPGNTAMNITGEPGGNKAELVLADGSSLVLDSNSHRSLLQGSTRVLQEGDQLLYQPDHNHDENTAYNTLKTPRGGSYKLVLPDGSTIWLNALSSVKFPVNFNNQAARKIQVTGEIYIEVSPGKRPFIVSSPEQEVQVLGTKFNINAYGDENKTITTLIEGKVKVVYNHHNELVLLPGQQSFIDPLNSSKIVKKEADIEQVTAWKNGFFHFENQSLDKITMSLSRWYNIDFKLDPAASDLRFSAVMDRSLNLDQILSDLSATGTVRFVKEQDIIKVYLK
ncbi:hypothetical protein COR50_19015 [Chitinophaga caeni]|uniref:FecR family protein n=1 Tax=Chitinophaga caeni TaxID=2029983 RepID=A0A291QYV4_9BACT|nr:FecR domain-containing protein [Chitinophaga caeni]ATL49091.1 hypothetical protein COR50_19015 [Chitinophaga caeni]